MVVQIGNGSAEPGESVSGLEIEWFRLKSSIQEYMMNASLIISHGGEPQRVMGLCVMCDESLGY